MSTLSSDETHTRLIHDIYQPCIAKYGNVQHIQDILEVLDNGKAVLGSEAECDQYIAFYSGHHFHKLSAAFASTNFHYTNGKNLEIIDWGCGQALATCVLIDYFFEKSFNPNIVLITLIEPSLTALKRGYNLLARCFSTSPMLALLCE